MARDDPHFRLRLPWDLKERIERDAKWSKRSINAEIISRIERTIAQDDLLETTQSMRPGDLYTDGSLDLFMSGDDMKLLLHLLELKLSTVIKETIKAELKK